MVRRVCPVCDRVMRGNHYCSVCKRWVRHPYVMNVDYFLNERHPGNEKNCEYHGGSSALGAEGHGEGRKTLPQRRSLSGQPSGPAREMTGSRENKLQQRWKAVCEGALEKNEKESKGVQLVILVITIIAFLLELCS